MLSKRKYKQADIYNWESDIEKKKCDYSMPKPFKIMQVIWQMKKMAGFTHPYEKVKLS